MATFAQLSYWIDPVEVRDVVRRIETDDAALKRRNTICLPSGVLQSGSEAGFKDMVESYLKSFQIPHSAVVLTMHFCGCTDISVRALSAMAGLRFDGTVTSYEKPSVPDHMDKDTILKIEGTDLLLELIRYPCMALLDIVTECAAFYRQKRKLIESLPRAEFVPSAPSRLQILIETVVASHFGLHVAAEEHGLETPRINQGYQSLTVSCIPPIPDLLLTAARTSALLSTASSRPRLA